AQALDPRLGRGKGITRSHVGGHGYGLGIARMADVNTGDARVPYLSQHPAVGVHVSFAEPQNGRRHECRREPVTGAGAPAVLQTAHELAQVLQVEKPVLELDIDRVRIGLAHLLPLLIGVRARANAPARVINRLAVFPQLDHLVQAARLVVQIDGGCLFAGVDRAVTGAAAFFIPAATAAAPARRARVLRRGRACGQTQAQHAARSDEVSFFDVHFRFPSDGALEAPATPTAEDDSSGTKPSL